MPGPNRINIWGVMCSCVVQGAIMGGLFLSHWSMPPRLPDRRESHRALVVQLIPLGADGHSRTAAATPTPSRKSLPMTGSGAARTRPLAVAQPVDFARVASVSTPAAAAPVAAGGAPAAASAAELSEYQRRLYVVVARNSRYPEEAKRLRLSGVTHLAFRLDRLGNVLESWVQESSGSELLDAAALAALRRSQPLPPIPPGLPSRLDFVIEIDSSLQQQLARAGG